MRTWVTRLGVLALLVIGGYLLVETVFVTPPITVGVVDVERGRVESTITNSKAGTVEARRRGRLSPEIGGRVIELPVREGARIEAGQVLLRLDDDAARAQLTKAQRDLTTAEARHREACLAADHAERELQRYEALAERRIVSQSLLDELRSRSETSAAGCEGAAAAVASAEAAIAVIDSELRKYVLRAPFPGVVAELSIELGEWTTPSPPGLPMPPVIEIIDTSSIYVSAPMDEVDSARIRPGQPVRVSIDSHRGESFAGTVERVAPYVLDIEAQNRTVEIDVALRDADLAATLLPGTSADVEVILEVHDDALRVPTATLLEGNAVMIVQDGVLTRRTVQTGLRNWDYTEIIAGLTASDRVVSTLDRPEIQIGAVVVVEDDGATPVPGTAETGTDDGGTSDGGTSDGGTDDGGTSDARP